MAKNLNSLITPIPNSSNFRWEIGFEIVFPPVGSKIILETKRIRLEYLRSELLQAVKMITSEIDTGEFEGLI